MTARHSPSSGSPASRAAHRESSIVDEIGDCAAAVFLHTRLVSNAVRCGVVVSLVTSAVTVHAEGERSPMIGGSVIAARGDAGDTGEQQGLVGINLEATYWIQRIGLAVEGSRRWAVEGGEPLATTLAGGLRLLLLDRLFESYIEPRDVELGLEVHGLVERTWWDSGASATTAYGAGLALRLRGGGDGFDSKLLAESRLFVRVMRSTSDDAFAARMTTGGSQLEPAPMTIVIGLGAVWGTGERKYADKFKPRFSMPVTPLLVDP